MFLWAKWYSYLFFTFVKLPIQETLWFNQIITRKNENWTPRFYHYFPSQKKCLFRVNTYWKETVMATTAIVIFLFLLVQDVAFWIVTKQTSSSNNQDLVIFLFVCSSRANSQWLWFLFFGHSLAKNIVVPNWRSQKIKVCTAWFMSSRT